MSASSQMKQNYLAIMSTDHFRLDGMRGNISTLRRLSEMCTRVRGPAERPLHADGGSRSDGAGCLMRHLSHRQRLPAGTEARGATGALCKIYCGGHFPRLH